MSASQDEPANRLERRKQRTRAALIQAAQALIAEGKLNVPVLEITQAADVGMGSFYNHFDSKEALSMRPWPMCSTTTVRYSIDSPSRSTTRLKHLPAAFGLLADCFGAARRRARSCWSTVSAL